MANYNYDANVLKGYGVGPFLNEVKTREAMIEAAPAEPIQSIFNANIVASKLHPKMQNAVVSAVEEVAGGKLYTLTPNREKGTEQLAYFRAGQFVSLALFMNDIFTCRPYTICSSPQDALGENSFYQIMVKKAEPGCASVYINDSFEIGTEVILSGPLGHYYFQDLRDSKNVIAAAGGSGITPFISMARAIAAGIEDFNLTILYGCKTYDSIVFRKELDEIAATSNGKVRVVYFLENEGRDGCEKGTISARLIRKYAGDVDYSLFVCGNQGFLKYMKDEAARLDLPIRRARFEVPGELGDPSNEADFTGDASREHKITIIARDKTYETTCLEGESLIHAIEREGIMLTTDCRSGICGWCHSRLVSGDVYVPASHDGRREADIKFGWIHPCASYPLTDIMLEVFPL